MVLILRQDLKPGKLLRKELTKVHGISAFTAHQICDTLGLASTFRVGGLSIAQKERLVRLVQRYYAIGSDLKRLKERDIQRYIKINSLRGQRLYQGLPVRGQRSHTNARTSRKRKN